jgi:hypothetical protein
MPSPYSHIQCIQSWIYGGRVRNGLMEADIGDLGQNSEQLRGTSRVVVHFSSSSLLQALAPPIITLSSKTSVFLQVIAATSSTITRTLFLTSTSPLVATVHFCRSLPLYHLTRLLTVQLSSLLQPSHLYADDLFQGVVVKWSFARLCIIAFHGPRWCLLRLSHHCRSLVPVISLSWFMRLLTSVTLQQLLLLLAKGCISLNRCNAFASIRFKV